MFKKLKKIRYFIEAIIVYLALIIFKLFPIDKIALICARISIFIGKRLSVNKLALENISKAFPEFETNKHHEFIEEMWDNLGRVVGEFVHIASMNPSEIANFVELDEETRKNLDALIANNKGGIIFSAHFGNWEIGPKTLMNYGLKVHTLYRPLNNPLVEKLTASLRGISMIAKGNDGNKKIINALKNKEFIIILADQKISFGEPIKFFHDDAITSTAIAKMALKYDVPLIPGCIFRINKSFRFKMIIEKPIEFNKNFILNNEAKEITLKMNQKIENWIRISPSQWFWVHNRWKK